MLSRLLTRKEQLVILALAAAICLGALALYVHARLAPIDAPRADAPPLPVQPITPLPDEPPEPLPASKPEPPAAQEIEAGQLLAVSAAGAVEKPGLYRLVEGARVKDLIDFAGGATESADLSDINLAAALIDGTTVTIPEQSVARIEGDTLVLKQGQTAAELNLAGYTISGYRASQVQSGAVESTGTQERVQVAAASGPVDLNAAGATELEGLPGIGPKLAAQIVEFRTIQPFRCVEDLLSVPGIGEKKLEVLRPHVTVR